GAGVAVGETALPDVHPVLAAGLELVAPGEALLDEAAAGGELPLGLGGQAGARPGAEGPGVVPGDVDDRMVLAALEGGAGALGAAPISLEDLPPPFGPDQRPGLREVIRQEAGED